jgi:hypothetical protein
MLLVRTMQNIKPKSIGQIRNEVSAKWFRVRDVTTLRDYLVLEFTHVGIANDPRWADVVCCDDNVYGSIDCTLRKYALLSSDEELASFRRHKKNAVASQIVQAYKNSGFIGA